MTRVLRGQSGQALVEMAIVVVLLLTLLMAVFEFGRVWMIGTMLTNAASDGARMASVVPSTERDANGLILNLAPIQDQVRTEIAKVAGAAAFGPAVVTQSGGGGTIPMVTVAVTGDVPYAFNIFGTSFNITRAVSFRDEGR